MAQVIHGDEGEQTGVGVTPCLIKFLCVHKLSVCACVRAYVSVCVLVTFQEVITAGKVTYTPTTPVKTQNLKTYPLSDFHDG